MSLVLYTVMVSVLLWSGCMIQNGNYVCRKKQRIRPVRAERVKRTNDREGLMSATGVCLPTLCPHQTVKRPCGFLSPETCQFNTKSR